MNDTNNTIKSTIADKIHQAVSNLLETEMRLNNELSVARNTIREHEQEIARLQASLTAEQEARRNLEQMISKVSDLVAPRPMMTRG